MDDKAKALQSAIAYLERSYGKNAVVCLGDDSAKQKVEVIPSGLLGLDRALGVGGMPRGRIVEIYGPEASGKTTLALLAAASAQRAGETVSIVDAEHALDTSWAAKLGVDISKLLISQPTSGDEGLDIVDKLVASRAVGLIIIDSVAALVPKAEVDGTMGDQLPGLQARLMSQAMRKLASQINKSGAVVIFINQLRHKIGALMPGQSPETTAGGNALKFYASVRIDVRYIGKVMDKGDEKVMVGRTSRARIVKNKIAPPFRETEFTVTFATGVNHMKDALDQALALKIVEKAGAWFKYKGKNVAQGEDNACEWLKGEPTVVKAIETAVRGAIAAVRAAGPAAEAGKGEVEEPAEAPAD